MAEKLAPAAVSSDDFFRALDTQLLVHELKGPLSLIEAAARTLIEQAGRMGPLTERQEKTVKRILRGTLRGRRLVDQLLEIGRAESAELSLASLDVGEAVLKALIESVENSDAQLAARLSETTAGEAQRAVLAQAGVTIKIAPEINRVRIFQDPVKFALIVGNLIQNALHFRRRSLEIVLDREADDLIVDDVADDQHAVAVDAEDEFSRRGTEEPVLAEGGGTVPHRVHAHGEQQSEQGADGDRRAMPPDPAPQQIADVEN